jgi:hypothetical protein
VYVARSKEIFSSARRPDEALGHRLLDAHVIGLTNPSGGGGE